MQVEVSKYTEGVNDKALRPNGLSKSLIRYDGICFSASLHKFNKFVLVKKFYIIEPKKTQ